MNSTKADRRVLVLFYLLISYILIQFVWWAFMLIKLNTEIYQKTDLLTSKVWMVVGEGLVFLIFLIAGAYIMQRSIRKEMALVRQQRNFLLSITHELKTPLAAIKLCIETLEKHKNLDPEKQVYLQGNALANTERLSSLIDRVLLATRIESEGEKLIYNPIDIVSHAQSIIARIANSSLNKSKIELDAKQEVLVRIDPQNFDSILSNVVDNAIKYGGNSEIKVSIKKQDQKAILEVIDQGIGIDPINKEKVFEKFFREGNEETRTKKGTGLGLFIVKKLVGLHKGSIVVLPNKPHGACFIITFPSA
jgi:signal transduction histidine kinase